MIAFGAALRASTTGVSGHKRVIDLEPTRPKGSTILIIQWGCTQWGCTTFEGECQVLISSNSIPLALRAAHLFIAVLLLFGQPWTLFHDSRSTGALAQDTIDSVFNDFETDPEDELADKDSDFHAGYFDRTWAEFNDPYSVEGTFAVPQDNGTYYYWEGRFTHGIEFRGFPNGTTPEYNSADCREDDEACEKHCFVTCEIWFPGPDATLHNGTEDVDYSMAAQLGGSIQPIIVVASGSSKAIIEAGPYGSAGPSDDEALQLGRYLASRGIVYVRWTQGNFIDPEDTSLSSPDPLYDQFGYSGNESAFSMATRDILMSFGDNSHGGDNSLSRSDLRLDYRFALAQGAIVTGTFVRRLVVQVYETFDEGLETPTAAENWAEEVKLFYSGGSKYGLAAITAAAANYQNTIGLRVGGAQSWNLGDRNETTGEYSELSAFNRYETDWLEGVSELGGRKVHDNTIQSYWFFESATDSAIGLDPPFHADIYVPSSYVDRFESMLILDDVGTHDANFPLASPEKWFRDYDGLDENSPWELDSSPLEDSVLDVRRVRNINRDHGRDSLVDEISVNALVEFDGDLYAAGLFGLDGGPAEHRVAKWDTGSSEWVAIATSFNGPVYALGVAGSTAALYAGGGFTTANEGATSVNYVAKLSSGSWAALSSNDLDGPVRALLGDGSTLWVGGDFTVAGGNSNCAHIAKYNTGGPSWSALSAGLNGPVHSIAKGAGSNFYVAGLFTQPNGVGLPQYANVARWAGLGWANLSASGGVGVSPGPVHALRYVGSTSTLYVGGAFTSAGVVSTRGVAKWESSAWAGIDKGVQGAVYALDYYDDTGLSNADFLYVGGSFNNALTSATGGAKIVPKTSRIAKFDLSLTTPAWVAMDEGANADVLALVADPASAPSLIVGGRFGEFGHRVSGDLANVSANLVGRWSSSTWTARDAGIERPMTQDTLLLRRSLVHLMKTANTIDSELPKVTRAEFTPDPDGATDWTIQVHTDQIPDGAPVAWTAYLAFSDDRDFRRQDGPSSSPGPVNRALHNIGFVFPDPDDDNRYYDPTEAASPLGPNVTDGVPAGFERASIYFDTKDWEDRFVAVSASASADGNGFYTLTFDAPAEYDHDLAPLYIACIVSMRVGAPDDGEEDDLVYTEVAFANEDDYLPNYLDALPEVSNQAAGITQVWPSRAHTGDYVYIVGHDFFGRWDGSATIESGIESIKFNDGVDHSVLITTVNFVGTRLIYCKLPTLDPGVYSVTVEFEDSTDTPPSLASAIKIDTN